MTPTPPGPDAQPYGTTPDAFPAQPSYGDSGHGQAPGGQPGYGRAPYARPGSGYSQGPSGTPPYGAVYPGAVAGTSTLAIVGLILAFFFWPAGLVVSGLALRQTRRTGQQGRGLALAGVIISSAVLLLTIAGLTIGIAVHRSAEAGRTATTSTFIGGTGTGGTGTGAAPTPAGPVPHGAIGSTLTVTDHSFSGAVTGTYQATLQSVTPLTPGPYDTKPTGQYVGVVIALKGLTGTCSTDLFDYEVVDSQGTAYHGDSFVSTEKVPMFTGSTSFTAGDLARGSMVFDLPAKSLGTDTLVVTDQETTHIGSWSLTSAG